MVLISTIASPIRFSCKLCISGGSRESFALTEDESNSELGKENVPPQKRRKVNIRKGSCLFTQGNCSTKKEGIYRTDQDEDKKLHERRRYLYRATCTLLYSLCWIKFVFSWLFFILLETPDQKPKWPPLHYESKTPSDKFVMELGSPAKGVMPAPKPIKGDKSATTKTTPEAAVTKPADPGSDSVTCCSVEGQSKLECCF